MNVQTRVVGVMRLAAAASAGRCQRLAGRQRRAAGLARGALAAAVVVAGSMAGDSAALAAPPADPCPAVMPVSEVEAAANAAEPLVATGLTVSKGTEPEPFQARVLGVLTDGIAPEVDMILVEADSPALDRVGGIWAGMSGSRCTRRMGAGSGPWPTALRPARRRSPG